MIHVSVLIRNWWLVALRGVAALLFGLLTLFYPAASLAVLVLFFGAYALVNGIFVIAAAVSNRKEESYWVALLVSGVLSVAFGVLTFARPAATALALLYLIAAWAFITGILEMVAAIRLRKVILGEWMLFLAGLLSVILGVVLVLFPGPGALAVALWIGAYAAVFGILWIALAFRLRSWGRTHTADGRLRTA